MIKQRIFLSSNVNDLIKLNIDLENYEYVVSWINCSKNGLKEKSITFAGNHYDKLYEYTKGLFRNSVEWFLNTYCSWQEKKRTKKYLAHGGAT